MAGERLVPEEVRAAAREAVEDIDRAMHGTPDEKASPVMTISDIEASATALDAVLPLGIAVLQEHGETPRVRRDPGTIFVATDLLEIDDSHYVQVSGRLPDSNPPVGPFSIQTQTYSRPDGAAEGRFTNVSVRGQIEPDGEVKVEPQSIKLQSDGVTSLDGMAKLPRHGNNLRSLVTFTRAALPPKQ